MKVFIDSANIDEIRRINKLGIIDGVTTNPSLLAKQKGTFESIVSQICNEIAGDVSIEVAALDHKQMLQEGLKIAKLAKNIVIKLPLTWDGIKACLELSNIGIKVNMTLCFSLNQAFIAAKAGATYVSPFIGRIDDLGMNGMDLIKNIKLGYQNYAFKTQILAASIRNIRHISDCFLVGADLVTASGSIIESLLSHHLTNMGLDIFNKDWQKSSLTIL